ncbi:MAG: efflux RND transporter periplasmic adaptor subunit [Acidobacteria bacterium]|nr:efflux RND transporter periplasmic adaptor subunit [Acidobacteriota bacterium]
MPIEIGTMGIQKKFNTKFMPVPALVVVAAVLTAGLYLQPALAQTPGFNSAKSKASLPETAPEPEPERDRIYTVATGQIQKDLVLTGELKAAQSVVISAPDIRRSFSNMVTYMAREGSQIKKGELIVEFDDSSLLSEQSEAERTLDEAGLNIEKEKMDLEAERTDLLNSIAQAEAQLKQDELYGRISKELLPANTYQKYQLNLEKSKLSLEKAQEQYDNFLKSYDSQMQLVEITYSQAEIDLKQILSDIKLLKIYAPQDGILIYGDNWASNRKIQEGDTLFPGMEVASLPDLSSMQVEGYVYDTEYGSIAPDTYCTVRFDALPDFQTGGKIISRTNVASRKGFATDQKVFHVIVRLDKVDPQIMKPGMTARIDIPVVLAQDALSVPREYLGVDSDGEYYVLAGLNAKEADPQSVMVGAVGDRMVEIVSGLSAGASLLPVF